MKIAYILFITMTLALFSEERSFASENKLFATKDSKSCGERFSIIELEAKAHFSQRRFLLAAISYSNANLASCDLNHRAISKLGYANSLFQLGEVKAAKSEWETISKSTEFPEKFRTLAQLELLFNFNQPFENKRSELTRIISIWNSKEDRKNFQQSIEIANLSPIRKTQLNSIDFESQNQKSPLIAGLASGILPGAGQLYVGEYQTAAISIVLNSLFLLSTIELSKKDLGFTAAISGLAFSTVYIGNIISAVNGAKTLNKKQIELRDQKIQEQLRQVTHEELLKNF